MSRRLKIPVPSRRGFLAGATGLFGVTSLGGCDRFAATETGRRTLKVGEDANMFVQRLLLTPASLAREFPDSEISPWFKPNGTTDPEDKPYKALVSSNFEGFKLRIDGLVEHPLDLSLADLRGMPARTQTTRHDCVEGWSAIGKWTGVPLGDLLKQAALKPQARYIVFHCADTMEFEEGGPDEQASADPAPSGQQAAASDQPAGGAVAWGGAGNADAKTKSAESGGDTRATRGPKPIRYYESIDLTDAFHTQTILAYDMNGKPLPVSNGAPLRLRVERQLGYKQAKYVMRIEVTDGLSRFGKGNGGYWEDNGYDWYAGI